MCGATQQQQQLGQEEQQFYQDAQDEATSAFGDQKALLDQVTAAYAPILAKGPNSAGFSQPELDSLESQAKEGTAENYKGASEALSEGEAAEGGVGLPSGTQAEQRGQLATSAVNEESKEQLGITQADYGQGENEFNEAGKAMETAAGEFNPSGMEQGAVGAGNSASSEANTIAADQDSWVNAVIGAAGTVAGDASKAYID